MDNFLHRVAVNNSSFLATPTTSAVKVSLSLRPCTAAEAVGDGAAHPHLQRLSCLAGEPPGQQHREKSSSSTQLQHHKRLDAQTGWEAVLRLVAL